MPSQPATFGPVAAYYDELMAGVPYFLWVDYLLSLWERHHLAPHNILDLACGTGTVSRMLRKRGLSVVGVDLSAEMLEQAQEIAKDAGLDIPFVQQDAAELDLGEQRFDCVISLFDSLNYILEPERLQAAFQRVYAHLHNGGLFIFDLNTEYALAEGMFNQSSARRGAPLHYRWRSRYDPQSRICTVAMRFAFDPGMGGERQVFHETHRQRAYYKEEVAQWLMDVGFAKVTVYDAYTMQPAKKRSDRLFYVAAKRTET
jgi:ubiquinone/menaquinone biosynthesis C-methylase UbiE